MLQFEGIMNNRKITDRQYVLKKFGMNERLAGVISMRKEIVESSNALMKKLDGIIENGEPLNGLTHQPFSVSEKENIGKVIRAFMIDNNSYIGNTEYSNEDIDTFKRLEAIEHAYYYYPDDVAKVINHDLLVMVDEHFNYITNGVKDMNRFGGNILVQKGIIQQEELGGMYSKGPNIDRTANLLTKDEQAYTHYKVLGNVARHLIPNQAIPEDFESYQSYLDYLRILKNLDLTNTADGANVDKEISRLRDVITKSKGQDHLDIYRSKSPLFQSLAYAGHLANVMYQDNML